jgi:competence protein ComEA
MGGLFGWLSRNQALVLAAALALLGVGLIFDAVRDGGAPPLVFEEGTAGDGAILVQVAGAVARPGVVELRAGDRVLDALEAAGGPAADADLDGLNLARRLRDGELIEVPRSGPPARPTLAPEQRVNINTAPVEVLDALPGIGEAYSRRIVDSRIVDGPFRSPEDLVTRRVIPRATFEGIRDLIEVAP